MFSVIYMIRIRFFWPGEFNQNGFGPHSKWQKDRNALAAVNVTEMGFDDREGARVEKAPLYSSRWFERFLLVRRFVGEVTSGITLPRQTNHAGRWFKDRRPESGGQGRARLVAAVKGTLMQQSNHVIVLTSSDFEDKYHPKFMVVNVSRSRDVDILCWLDGTPERRLMQHLVDLDS